LGVNYLGDHLPIWRRLGAPTCPNCETHQALVGYFLWPRKCPTCGWTHRRRSLIVDALALGATSWLWMAPPARLGFWPAYLLLVFFLVVVVIDLEHRLILHVVSLVGAVLGLGIGVWLHGFTRTLVGGAVGFGAMLVLYYLGAAFTRLLARLRGEPIEEVALGFGDVNLAGVLGLLLGWPGIVVGLFLGVFIGGLASLLYMAASLLVGRYRSFAAIPYAPYLVAGAVLLLYFPEITSRLLAGVAFQY
jgi:leader peptidase (prepilin peptidase)/N-methyltransferase